VILALGVLALQVYCIVDVIKRGRNTFWVFPLLIFPVVSAIAYFVVEVLPGLQNNRHVRTAKQTIVEKIDPERELRAAQQALDLSETMANHMRLADALSELGRHKEALIHYQRGAGAIPDFHTGEKLARSLFMNDKPREALSVLDKSPKVTGQTDRDRSALLRARILEDMGQQDEALTLYGEICDRVAGDEARCRYAALLLKAGRTGEARRVLEDVEHRMKFLDRRTRNAEAAMYDWAMRELAALRS
jgi:hypothetical protein